MKTKFLRMSESALGVFLCGAAALVAAAMSVQRPWRIFVPLAFVAVIAVLAVRCGMAVGMLGSLITALIFAYFLFAPLRSFHVDDRVEREALAWMVLAGVAVPFLFAPAQPPRPRHK